MIVNQKNAIELLKKGKVIGVPTDTVYGLAVLEEYEDKIYDLKGRNKNKKIINLIYDYKYILNADEILLHEMKKSWPGNVTFIYKINEEFESFRIPDEINLLNLLKNIDKPLKVSSANYSNEKACTTKIEFEKTFPNIPLLEEKIKTNKTGINSEIYIYENKKFMRLR